MKSQSFELQLFDSDNEDDPTSVKVTFPKIPKMDLGGFRDIENGKEYLHAFGQTDTEVQYRPILYERDTQTVDVSIKSQNPKREFGSQTPKPNEVWIDQRSDKVLVPGKYFDSDLWLLRRIEASIFIQKMMRGFLARKRIGFIKQIDRKLKTIQESIKVEDRTNKEQYLKEEIERRLRPKVISRESSGPQLPVQGIDELEEGGAGEGDRQPQVGQLEAPEDDVPDPPVRN